MAFRLGLTSEPLAVFLGVLARDDDRGASPVGFVCFAAPLAFASGLGGITCREGGARLLLMPRRPRFMILAGVTGVSWGLKFGEGGMSLLISCDIFDEDGIARLWGMGGAGGGMERSTGEGVSPGTSPAVLPLRERLERRRGVELVDLDPRKTFLLWAGFVGRMAGDGFFREGCMPLSSSLEDAWRLFVEVCMDC
jgi:hypothetical protein